MCLMRLGLWLKGQYKWEWNNRTISFYALGHLHLKVCSWSPARFRILIWIISDFTLLFTSFGLKNEIVTMLCAICYHLYNLKNMKTNHGGVLLLVKLEAFFTNSCRLFFACIFTKSNTSPWMFFTFFKLYKWYQIAQNIAYIVEK